MKNIAAPSAPSPLTESVNKTNSQACQDNSQMVAVTGHDFSSHTHYTGSSYLPQGCQDNSQMVAVTGHDFSSHTH